MATKCRYCNSSSYGSDCPHIPTKNMKNKIDEMRGE